MTEILNSYGFKAKEVLPEDLGLRTDGEYKNSSIDLKTSQKLLCKVLTEETIYVIPGFYGLSKEGKVNLLGRGGSDYSAAAIANCLGAESLDIWKDVDGFLTGDPRDVKNPENLTYLSYNEASELAYFGAKILHPRSVEPLIEKQIPLRIFNITKPDNPESPLSLIQTEEKENRKQIRSITSTKNISLLKFSGPGVGIISGVLSKISGGLEKRKINIKSVITSQTTITLLLDEADLAKAQIIARELNLHTICDISSEKDLSLIACVGEGIREKAGLAGRMFTAVSKESIIIRAISFGSSEVAVYFLVKQKDSKKALKLIHAEFFNKETKTKNSVDCHLEPVG